MRALIERIERMEEEKRAVAEDIREVYSEAKANGYDAKIMRRLVSIRRQDARQRAEDQAVLETYMAAVGTI